MSLGPSRKETAYNLRLVKTWRTLPKREPVKDMANKKVNRLFFAVLLVTGQVAAKSVVRTIVDGTAAAASIAYCSYRIYEVCSWFNKLATFLLDRPSLGDVPHWLLNNRPPFLSMFEILHSTAILHVPKWFVIGEKAEILKNYAQKIIPCGENKACSTAWMIVMTVWGSL